jgi:hypothetical protein
MARAAGPCARGNWVYVGSQTGEEIAVMRSTRGVWFTLVAVAAVVALLGGTGPAQAAKVDEQLAKTLGRTVVVAAHPTAQKVEMTDYKVSTPKDGRLVLDIRMKYFGKVTSAKYLASVRITLDTTKEPPKVVDINYKDDNKIPASKKGLKNAEDLVARKLPKKL